MCYYASGAAAQWKAAMVVVQPCQQQQAVCRHLGAASKQQPSPCAKPALSLLLVAVLGSSYDSEMSDAEPRPGQHRVSQHQVVDMVPDSAPAAMAQARPGRCWTWSC